MHRLPLAFLPLALLAAPGIAAERTPAVSPRLMAEFKASDANRDGVLTRAEVSARVTRMDAGTRKLPPERAKALAALWFARADANSDGKVTPSEMQQLFAATAARYDTNGDGVVSLAERRAARTAIAGEVKPGR